MAYNFIPISDAKQSRTDSVSFIGKIVHLSAVQEYKNKDGGQRKFIMITVADADDFTVVKSYQTKSMDTTKLNKTYAFIKVLVKDGMCPFWAISTSQLIPWAELEIPAEMVQKATTNNNVLEPNSPRKIQEALNCGSTSTICGKIVQTSPTKFVRAGSLSLKHLAVKDQAGSPTISIALFGQDAEHTYSEGDVVRISNVYKYKNTMSLSTKINSTVEFLPSTSLDLEICDDDKLDDDLFIADLQVPTHEPITVMGVQAAYIYDSCANNACRNKKLKDGKCVTCGRNSASKYCNAKVIVQHEGQYSEHMLFLPDISRLTELPDLSSFNNNDEFLTYLSGKLPINGRGNFTTEGKLSILAAKRSLDD